MHVRDSFQDHRQQLAELVKRTRYFIANKAKVDAPVHRGTQEEIGLRSFEGAAGGAVLLGHTPETPSLEQLFDWPDAHIHVPFGSREIADVIHQLDATPSASTPSVATTSSTACAATTGRSAGSWCCDKLGIAPTARLTERLDTLEQLAEGVDREGLAGTEGSSGLRSMPTPTAGGPLPGACTKQ